MADEKRLERLRYWHKEVSRVFFNADGIVPPYDSDEFSVKLRPNGWIHIEGGTSARFPRDGGFEEFIKEHADIFPGVDLERDRYYLFGEPVTSPASGNPDVEMISFMYDHKVPINGKEIEVSYIDETFTQPDWPSRGSPGGFIKAVKTGDSQDGYPIVHIRFMHFPPPGNPDLDFPDPIEVLNKEKTVPYLGGSWKGYTVTPGEISAVCDITGEYRFIKEYGLHKEKEFTFRVLLDKRGVISCVKAR